MKEVAPKAITKKPKKLATLATIYPPTSCQHKYPHLLTVSESHLSKTSNQLTNSTVSKSDTDSHGGERNKNTSVNETKNQRRSSECCQSKRSRVGNRVKRLKLGVGLIGNMSVMNTNLSVIRSLRDSDGLVVVNFVLISAMGRHFVGVEREEKDYEVKVS
jgi:hypothetical protein